ncbi:MAG TPA: hypothetical protein VF614_03260 [Chthoniobacteraceae bacterium]
MKYSSPLIETLESRIAPATILPGGKSIAYTDIDGDKVVLTMSAEVNEKFVRFDTAFGDTGPQALQLIDMGYISKAAGKSITLTAERGGMGGGTANVGAIDAFGVDLGTIKIDGDLGQITAGNGSGDSATPAVKSLTVNSLAEFGTSTQAAGGDTRSDLTGGIGKLKVKHDLFGEFNVLNTLGTSDGRIGKIKIGGSLMGGDVANSGTIFTQGDVGTVRIGESIFGGEAARSGQLNVGGKIGSVTIGQSLLGGSYNAASEGNASGAIISGRLAGADGSIGSITIGKNIFGGSGAYSATIRDGLHNSTAGGIGRITIGSSILGGNGDHSGVIHGEAAVGSITIEGSLVGSSGDGSGAIVVDGDLASVKIAHTQKGSTGQNSGSIHGAAIETIKIAENLIGGSGPGTHTLITADSLGKLIVGDSILASEDGGYQNFVEADVVGAIKVKGSIVGTLSDHVVLSIAGAPALAEALGSLEVGGDFQNADLLIGGGVNPDQQVGEIEIGGDFLASRIAVSTDNGADNIYGTVDDTTVNGPSSDALSRIVKIIIGGTATGTEGGTDSFRIIAGTYGSVEIAGAELNFGISTAPQAELALGTTQDLAIRRGTK